MGPQLRLETNGVGESLLKLLLLALHFLCPELFMNDLEGADLLDGAVNCPTVRAMDDFSTGGVDGFRDRLTLEVFEVRSSEPFEERSTVVFVQKDMGAGLEKETEKNTLAFGCLGKGGGGKRG